MENLIILAVFLFTVSLSKFIVIKLMTKNKPSKARSINY